MPGARLLVWTLTTGRTRAPILLSYGSPNKGRIKAGICGADDLPRNGSFPPSLLPVFLSCLPLLKNVLIVSYLCLCAFARQ